MGKYKPLLVGIILIWGAYFAFRTIQFLMSETAHGNIRAISWRHFVVGYGSGGDIGGSYMAPEIHFSYKHVGVDTNTPYMVLPQAVSSDLYKAGEQIDVIFPKGKPEQAEIYSLSEFWFTAPYVIVLTMVSIIWFIGFAFVVLKPWQ